MAEIRFKNLPLLLNDMKREGWIIDVFGFRYKGIDYSVILRLYRETEHRPIPHAQAALDICRADDLNVSIPAYIDFYEVRFFSIVDFCRFFDVIPGKARRDLILDFSETFATSIPIRRNTHPTPEQRQAMARRCDSNNPDAIYPFALRRHGNTVYGQKHRTIENSNKAALLCPLLWEKLKDEPTISFLFSQDTSKQRTEEEILRQYWSGNL